MAHGVSWTDLLRSIREEFSKDRIDVEVVKRLLSSYGSKREDWQPFAKFDTHRLAWWLEYCVHTCI